DSDGLIELTDYYTTTTATAATPGGVAGYYKGTRLQKGELGVPVPQDMKEYLARTSGVVDVAVTTPAGRSTETAADQFAYVMPPVPALAGLSPATGPTTGGTSVTLLGSGFSAASAVRFGTSVVTNLTVVSDNAIRVTAPARAAGAVDVTVTTPGGTS